MVTVIILCSGMTIGLGEFCWGLGFPAYLSWLWTRRHQWRRWRGYGGRGGAWVWRRRLLAWEEESVREYSALLHNIILQEQVHDKWRWLLDPIHGYLVRGVYRFLTTSDEPVVRDIVDDVWHKHIPSKVSLFVWRLLRNRLPTKENLARRSILPSTELACTANYGNSETAHRIFIGCGIADCVWLHVRAWLGICSVAPNVLRHHFVQFSYMAGMPRSSHIFFKVVWLACVWILWKERNHRIFKNMAFDPSVLIEKVKLNSFLWLKSIRCRLISVFMTGENIRSFVWVSTCNCFLFMVSSLLWHQWHCNFFGCFILYTPYAGFRCCH